MRSDDAMPPEIDDALTRTMRYVRNGDGSLQELVAALRSLDGRLSFDNATGTPAEDDVIGIDPSVFAPAEAHRWHLLLEALGELPPGTS